MPEAVLKPFTPQSIVAVAALLLNTCPPPRLNPLLKPDTSNILPPASVMPGLLAIEALPLKARVPAFTRVGPV